MEESNAAASAAPLPSEPAVHENGAAHYAVAEDPAAADEDDGFETASDPDVDDDSPAPKNPNPIDPEGGSSDPAPAGGGGGVEFVEAESEIADAGAEEKEAVTAAVDEKEKTAAAVPETVEVVPDPPLHKDEASFEEAVAEVAEDSKPDERDEEVENSGALESKELENLIPNEVLESDAVGAIQEVEAVEEPKAVGVESDAAVTGDVLEREDSKPVEAEAAGEAEEAGNDVVAVSDDGAKTEPQNAQGLEGGLVVVGSAETEAPVDVVVSEISQESAEKPDGEKVTESIAGVVVTENAQESAEKPDGEKVTEPIADVVAPGNAKESAEKPDGEKVTESIADVVAPENAQESAEKSDGEKVTESIVDVVVPENAQESAEEPGEKVTESIVDVVDSVDAQESVEKPDGGKVTESVVAALDSENVQESAPKPDGEHASECIDDVVDSKNAQESADTPGDEKVAESLIAAADTENAQDSVDKPEVEKVSGSIVDVVGSESAQDSADIYAEEKSTEAIVNVGGAHKDEGIVGDSVSEVANDIADKHDVLNDGDAVDGATGSVQKVEVAPILQEESKSREVEPVSVVEREMEPINVGAHAATDTATASGDDDENLGRDESEEEEDILVSDGPARIAILESSETAKQIIKEMEEGSGSASSHSGFRSSGERSLPMDGQIVSDSDEEVDTDEEGEGGELFDSDTLRALLKAATGASTDGGIPISSQDGTRIFSVDRPAGLGSSMPSLRPAAPRSSRPSPFTPTDLTVVAEPENDMNEDEKKLREKVEQIRVKFLRLVHRLGHSPEDTVVAQVLYRLGLAEGIRRGRQIGRGFSNESAKKKALQLEDDKKEDLDFSCNILVLGKTGVGKSATINSIFGESKSLTNAFQPATTSVREISGIVDGVKVRVIDTPGLKASVMDQAANQKVLHAIKKYTKRCPPDIVLYVDRMDTQTRDFNDLPLLRSITSILGSSIWFNAIVALSHAASAPPDGPNGSPLSYEVFIAQRSHVVQHSIRQAAGDMRLMNPVALVENHPSCRRNREGERVLPNGLSWRPQMLLLCYSSKILSEANSLLKLQDSSPGKLFAFRSRSPPLPYLLSSLLQSRAHPKLPTDQGGDNGDSDIDLDDLSDADQEEEEDEYDQLPPFKPLRKAQIAKLTKEQRSAYFDEYDYRVKLLQKKQWKDELRRVKEMKKKGNPQQDEFAYGEMVDEYDQDSAPAAVPVPLPDMVLPPSFDCDNPVYRYRFLEPTSQLLIRPVLDSHSWDHDCGYDGVSIEENLAIAGQFPAGVAVQITKDKKEFSVHLDSSIAAKHGENGSTLAGFDIQSIGKQLAYIVRGETKFKNLKKNKTAAGISVTFLGENIATGLKIEDQVSIGKRVNLVASTGAIRAQGDVAYGANLEARLKDKDYPIGQALSTLGLSLMKWRSDLALGANLQSQFSVGRNSKVAVRVGLNNKLTGQITVRTSTSEQLQIALVGVVPLALTFFRSFFPGESYMVN